MVRVARCVSPIRAVCAESLTLLPSPQPPAARPPARPHPPTRCWWLCCHGHARPPRRPGGGGRAPLTWQGGAPRAVRATRRQALPPAPPGGRGAAGTRRSTSSSPTPHTQHRLPPTHTCVTMRHMHVFPARVQPGDPAVARPPHILTGPGRVARVCCWMRDWASQSPQRPAHPLPLPAPPPLPARLLACRRMPPWRSWAWAWVSLGVRLRSRPRPRNCRACCSRRRRRRRGCRCVGCAVSPHPPAHPPACAYLPACVCGLCQTLLCNPISLSLRPQTYWAAAAGPVPAAPAQAATAAADSPAVAAAGAASTEGLQSAIARLEGMFAALQQQQQQQQRRQQQQLHGEGEDQGRDPRGEPGGRRAGPGGALQGMGSTADAGSVDGAAAGTTGALRDLIREVQVSRACLASGYARLGGGGWGRTSSLRPRQTRLMPRTGHPPVFTP